MKKLLCFGVSLILGAGVSVSRAEVVNVSIGTTEVNYEIVGSTFFVRSVTIEKKPDHTYTQFYLARMDGFGGSQIGPDLISIDGYTLTPGTSKTTQNAGSAALIVGANYAAVVRRIGGGFTYEKSESTFTFDGAENRVRIAGTNDKPYRIRIALIGNVTGDIVHAVEVAAGQVYDETFVLEEPDTSVTPHVFIQAAFEDGIWKELPEGEFGTDAAHVGEPIAATPDETPNPAAVDGEGLPGGKPAPTSQGQVVWRSGGATTPETALDKATFQEGINKLLEKSSSGAGGSTDMTATNAKLDSIKTNTATTATAAQGANTRLDDIKGTLEQIKNIEVARDEKAATQKAAAEGVDFLTKANAVKTEGQTVVQGLSPGVNGTAPQLGVSPTASIFTIEIGEYSFDFDPASSSRVSTVAAWLKAFVQWLLTGLYAWWCWGELQKFIMNMATLPQARGNTIGGTGGQISGFLAAGIITVAVFAAVPAIWALASTPSLGVDDWLNTSSIGSATTEVGGALYLVYFFLPVSFILAMIAQMFLFRKLALGVFLGIFGFVKFIVP